MRPFPSVILGTCLMATVGLPVAAHGQGTATDSSARVPDATTVQVMEGKLIDRLPVDRISGALILLPGVTPSPGGGLSLRGGSPRDVATYLDGVPILPGYRSALGDIAIVTGAVSLAGQLPAPPGYGIDLGTNSVQSASVMPGPLPARLGGAQSGVILLESPGAPTRFGVRGSFESDEPFGNTHGAGLNRFQLDGGAHLSAKLSVAVAGTLAGQQSAEAGPGVERIPLFQPADTDTTVAVPSALGDPFADTTLVDVARFAVSRGECDTFSSSSNPDIADNSSVKCDGVRAPSTGRSSYNFLGRMDYRLSPRSAAWITALASQEEGRSFSYDLLFVPQDQTAARGWSRLLTLGLHHEIKAGSRPLTLDAALSFQRDRAITGPLTTESELDTRDGMMFSQLHFAYDFDSFPLDDELVSNIRNNVAGSRQTPVDLSNTSQFIYVDQYRNSPYGLGGGPERGGPQGRMTLFRENRTVGIGRVGWRPDLRQLIEVGAEFTRYSAAGYSSLITTQAFIDAFRESPTRSAAYVQDRVELDRFTITGGIRYDRFHSNASRPFVLDTVSSSPNFGTYSYFPTPNSYGSGGITFNGQPLVAFHPDKTRTAVSPRLQVELVPFARSVLRVGVARQTQMPDFAAVFSGINTDFRVTNTSQVFGNDLDLEKTTTYEIGFRHQVSTGISFDAAYYFKDLASQLAFRLVPLADPARLGESVDIRQATSLGLATIKGIDARLDVRQGVMTGVLGYSYQQGKAGDGTQLAGSHPHSLTGIIAVDLPDSWHQGSLLGSVLRSTGVYATLRYTSGTPYTACPAGSGDESVLAGEICARTFAGDFLGARLPSFRQLDLRITRSFSIGSHQLMAYLDARNLLNFRNVLEVFAVTGTASNPSDRQLVYAQDSSGYWNEGIQNGVVSQNGDIDLRFGGAIASGCGQWVDQTQTPAAPNCVYLIRAEERFGDGDHVFTVAEQRRASDAHYDAIRGESNFLGAPRRMRLGLEIRF